MTCQTQRAVQQAGVTGIDGAALQPYAGQLQMLAKRALGKGLACLGQANAVTSQPINSAPGSRRKRTRFSARHWWLQIASVGSHSSCAPADL